MLTRLGGLLRPGKSVCGDESLPKVSCAPLPYGGDRANLIKLSETLLKEPEAFSQKQGAGPAGA